MAFRFTSLFTSFGIGAVALVVLGVACKSEKPPETGYLQGGVQYGAGGAAAGYGGGVAYAGTAWAGSTTWSPTPGGGGAGGYAPIGGSAGTPTGAAGFATSLDPGAATVLGPVLTDLAKQYIVAGAKPLGAPMVGSFVQSQKLEGMIQLQPNKCYTVVATAMGTVQELNVQIALATPLPNLNPVLAIDSETGPTAVVGKKPNCYKWAWAMGTPAKVILEVPSGQGLAMAQVYEK